WNMSGASTRKHPAPFPIDLAYRLVRMFSFAGDTVLDPFAGTGTTMVAAMRARRSGIGFEIDPTYCRMARERAVQEPNDLFGAIDFRFEKSTRGQLAARAASGPNGCTPAKTTPSAYKHRKKTLS